MKNKKRITIGVVVVLLALAAILAVIMLKKFAPNKTHMSLTKYFQVTDQGMMPVVLEDDICGLKAIEKDGHIYVDRVKSCPSRSRVRASPICIFGGIGPPCCGGIFVGIGGLCCDGMFGGIWFH